MNNKLYSIKNILADLVAFPVVSGDSNLAIVKYITNYLSNYGIKSRLSYDDSGERANVFATLGPTDVVTVAGQNWTHPPFELKEINGRLYGRGSVDMKGFLALCLAQVPELVCADLKRPIHFGITYDEETGSHGAKVLARDIKDLPHKPTYCIVGEPTQLQVIAAHKGGYEITTHIKGVDGHSSDPARGVSAIHYAVRLMNHLLDVRAELATKIDPDSPFRPACSTINIGTLKGGVSRSTIAQECYFDWELRVMPNQDGEPILAKINEFVDSELLSEMKSKFPQSSIETVVDAAYPGLAQQTDSDV